jgi:hypothetical protein
MAGLISHTSVDVGAAHPASELVLFSAAKMPLWSSFADGADDAPNKN